MHTPQPDHSSSTKSAATDIATLNAAYKHRVSEQLSQSSTEEVAFRQSERARARQHTEIANDLEVITTHIRKWTSLIIAYLRKIFERHKQLWVAGAACSVAVASYMALSVVILPQTIHFSFSKSEACVVSPALFPDILSYQRTTTFALSRPSYISLGKTIIFSNRLCASPQRSPRADMGYTQTQSINLLGLHINKGIHINTSAYALAQATHLSVSKKNALPLIQPLQFKLDALDTVFNYALVAGHSSAPCMKQRTLISCNLQSLNLSYGATYDISLVREFHQRIIDNALNLQIHTIVATGIVQTSIAPASTVYTIPQQITLQTSKPLTKLTNVSLTYVSDNKVITVPTTSSFKGSTVTVILSHPLPRQTTFDLRIGNVTATDQSQLEQAYNLSFSTSGGPKVTTINIPVTGVSLRPTIHISFDQVLSPSQPVSQLVSLLANGIQLTAVYSITGNELNITPQSPLPVCAHIGLKTNDTIQSQYGISGNSAWSFAARAECYTTSTIGTSAQGRPITAYQFGNGPSMVLYIGAMEGNEQNSMQLLEQWIPALDATPDRIPASRTIVVIPAINPDGVAANTRLNANGIDLNRNFPSDNWQEQVTEPLANTVWTNDGGPSPLSEPESQALANFELAHKPRLVLTMHSHGGIVEANDAADSIALGQEYARLADYRAIPTYAIGNFFNYTTTGAFEDWAHDKLGLAVLEVELESPTDPEFSRNLAALWAMAQVSP